jgi:hypothetical protein
MLWTEKGVRHLFSEEDLMLADPPVGRPPNHVRVFHASFSYQAASWEKFHRPNVLPFSPRNRYYPGNTGEKNYK